MLIRARMNGSFYSLNNVMCAKLYRIIDIGSYISRVFLLFLKMDEAALFASNLGKNLDLEYLVGRKVSKLCEHV